VLLGDKLAARYCMDDHAAVKGNHTWLHPWNWAYRTYLTSFGFDANGNPQINTVVNTGVTQVLQLRHDRPLVGVNALVSVEWDASSAYLSQLAEGFRSASQYLYDVTDGQMLLESIDIQDNKANWADADYRIHASNRQWPCADLGGIWKGTDKHAFFGRYFDGRSSSQGDWTLSNGYRTLIHEFGHYGLGLDDEYVNAKGQKGNGAGCTTDFDATVPAQRACVMSYQFTSTQLCSSLTLHPHNTNTLQQTTNGGPCWDTVQKKYRDFHIPERWAIVRPNDRGSIMPGPLTIPISDWVKSRVVDVATGACAPQTVVVAGSVFDGADVWLFNPSGTSVLYEGLTYSVTASTNEIDIMGAHDGDKVWVHKSLGGFFL
jgi:hypothetical protein